MKLLKCLATSILLLAACSARAVCPVQETTIFFINGMNNDEPDAQDSRDLIEKILKQQSFFNAECITVKYAYARTEGLTKDLLEAARQKEIEENLTPTNFWEMFERLVAPRPWFLDLVAIASFAVPDARDEKILVQIEEHLDKYRAEPVDNRILLFGHSQGTLFANEEWFAMTLEERERTKLIAVATPARRIADDGPYILIEEDLLITTNFIGALEPTSLPLKNQGWTKTAVHDSMASIEQRWRNNRWMPNCAQRFRGRSAGNVFIRGL